MEINLIPFPELKTSRLLLRRLIMDDRTELIKLRSDERVNQYLERSKTMTMDEATAHVAKIDKILDEQQGVYWVISLAGERELIGAICFWNFEPEKNLVELGYELNSAYHGKGIMLEAAQKVIEYAFKVMKVRIIIAVPHPDNASSVKLLTRKGFEPDKNRVYVREEDTEGRPAYFLIRE